MKKIFCALVFACASLFAGQAAALPCVSGSVASYAALGSTGCTVGSLMFSDFALLPVRPTGADPFAGITIAPQMAAGQVGLQFLTSPTGIGPDQFFDDLISYRVAGLGVAVTGATFGFLPLTTVGDALATGVQNLCLAGLFGGADGVSGCTGMSLAQIIVAFGGATDDPASLTFAPAASLAVVTDLGFEGGTDGSLAAAGASNLFATAVIAVVPEPSSTLLLSLGLLGLLGTRALGRRRT